MDIPDNIEIIVIDNFSTDGTFKAISDLTTGSRIKIYRNNKNLGFAGNFVEPSNLTIDLAKPLKFAAALLLG